ILATMLTPALSWSILLFLLLLALIRFLPTLVLLPLPLVILNNLIVDVLEPVGPFDSLLKGGWWYHT
ncbi:hypothetical protein ABTD35_21230, partial [Acinetobacter baumannii]